MNEVPRRAVFFDRDGVLNVDHGYVYRPDQFEWIQGSKQAIRRLNRMGILVIVVTNQSGVARGLYTMEHVEELMRSMQGDLAELEARIDRWYVCPHHPNEGNGAFTMDCSCRKPKPGMILSAIDDFGLEPANCLLIGDKDRDLDAAAAAGVSGKLFRDGDLDGFLVEQMQEAGWLP